MGFTQHCKTVFVEYVETHDYTTINNDMNHRTCECISLRPTENIQGTQKILTYTQEIYPRGEK